MAKRRLKLVPGLVLVLGDEWEGLYKDGKLVLQDHSIDFQHAMKAMGTIVKVATVDEAWLDKKGTLPESLTDVYGVEDQD